MQHDFRLSYKKENRYVYQCGRCSETLDSSYKLPSSVLEAAGECKHPRDEIKTVFKIESSSAVVIAVRFMAWFLDNNKNSTLFKLEDTVRDKWMTLYVNESSEFNKISKNAFNAGIDAAVTLWMSSTGGSVVHQFVEQLRELKKEE